MNNFNEIFGKDRLAIMVKVSSLLQGTLESAQAVWGLNDQEKLGVVRILSELARVRHIQEAQIDVDEILGDDLDEDEEGDVGPDPFRDVFKSDKEMEDEEGGEDEIER